jgi:sugar transferase (PEP-CTERM system associated)
MIRVFRQDISLRSWFLLAAQSCLIVFCAYLAAALRFSSDSEAFSNYTAMPGFALKLAFLILAVQTCLLVSREGNGDEGTLSTTTWVERGRALGSAAILLGSLYFFVPKLLVGRGVFFIAMVLISFASGACEAAFRKNWAFAKPQRILILGTDELAFMVGQTLRRRDDLNLHIVGFVAESPSKRMPDKPISRDRIVGEIDEIRALVEKHRVDRIVVAMQERRGSLPTAALVQLKVRGVIIEEAHVTLACLTGHLCLRAIRPSSFVFSDGFRRSNATMVLKRILDLSLATTGFIIALPIMLLLIAAIKLESPGAAMYRQSRVGRQGRCFELLKLRSMRDDAERHGAQWAVANDPRVTRIGKFIRQYRLDELPQFLNIIRGEMSFVGPRPERPLFVEQLREAIPYYDERHSVRPGLTGWAQVRYGYGATIGDATRKLEYDLFYLQNMSIFFDCAIVLRTAKTVLSGFERRKVSDSSVIPNGAYSSDSEARREAVSEASAN